MCSPLSPIVANIFMQSFRQEAVQLAKNKPRLWVRYIDDTFVIWQNGLDKLEPSKSISIAFKTPLNLQWRPRERVSYPS